MNCIYFLRKSAGMSKLSYISCYGAKTLQVLDIYSWCWPGSTTQALLMTTDKH